MDFVTISLSFVRKILSCGEHLGDIFLHGGEGMGRPNASRPCLCLVDAETPLRGSQISTLLLV
jgi:hypothetical protein